VPGVDMTTGSLGQGLGAAVGIALGLRFSGKNCRVFAVLGDGEIQEGSIWESAMAAAHFKLGRLTAVLDYNNVQLDGRVSDIMDVAPVVQKWQAFGWLTRECNGHDVRDLCAAFDWADQERTAPAIIVAHTIKGKGVSFMEGNSKLGWSVRACAAG
jgi:transketolase